MTYFTSGQEGLVLAPLERESVGLGQPVQALKSDVVPIISVSWARIAQAHDKLYLARFVLTP